MKENESDLEYLKRLKGQLSIGEMGFKAISKSYTEMIEVLNDPEATKVINDFTSASKIISDKIQIQIMLLEREIEIEEDFPQCIPMNVRLGKIMFSG